LGSIDMVHRVIDRARERLDARGRMWGSNIC